MTGSLPSAARFAEGIEALRGPAGAPRMGDVFALAKQFRHAATAPRFLLRYAIEHMDPHQRRTTSASVKGSNGRNRR